MSRRYKNYIFSCKIEHFTKKNLWPTIVPQKVSKFYVNITDMSIKQKNYIFFFVKENTLQKKTVFCNNSIKSK